MPKTAAKRRSDPASSRPGAAAVTIGGLARAAEVGIEQGGSRSALRKIAGDRLTNIREKIVTLERMERMLSELLCECEHTATAAPCPIIAALNTHQ